MEVTMDAATKYAGSVVGSQLVRRQREILQFPTPISRDTAKEKLADHPVRRRRTRPSLLRRLVQRITDFFSDGKEEPSEPLAPVAIQLKENQRSQIRALRIQIGDDEDNATRLMVELVHKNLKGNVGTELELYLIVQGLIQGDEVPGRIEQATIHIQFCEPVSQHPITMDAYGPIDVVPTPKVMTQTEESESAKALTLAAKVSKSEPLGGTYSWGSRHNIQEMVEGYPTIRPDGLDFGDHEVRWMVEVTHSVASSLRQGFRHRISQNLPIRANIRVSCQCGKEKYAKPRNENERLSILLYETNDHKELE